MARLELLPLSVTELHGQPLNVIDHLSAGEFTHVPAASETREDIAGLVLRGGYPEVQSKSRRGRQAWFRSYHESPRRILTRLVLSGRLLPHVGEVVDQFVSNMVVRKQPLVPELKGCGPCTNAVIVQQRWEYITVRR